MKSVLAWQSLLLTIFLWLFVWQLYDLIVRKFEVTEMQQTIVSIIGLFVIGNLIYNDKYYK